MRNEEVFAMRRGSTTQVITVTITLIIITLALIITTTITTTIITTITLTITTTITIVITTTVTITILPLLFLLTYGTQELHLDYHKDKGGVWKADSLTFFVCLSGTRKVSLGRFGLLVQEPGDLTLLSSNAWHAGTPDDGGVIMFGYLDR